MRLSDDARARFEARYVRTSGCWLWQGMKNPKGYGLFSYGGKTHRAQRIAYRLYVGPIMSGCVIHHDENVCLNRACVNPAHLRQVTPLEHRAIHEWLRARSLYAAEIYAGTPRPSAGTPRRDAV